VFLTAALGIILGLIAGYLEGWIGDLIMRIADIQLALPFILLTIAILTVIQPTIINIILALAITRWVGYTRTVRALVFSVKNSDYVLAAKALGASDSRILFRYIMPNILSPLIALGGIQLAFMVTMESTLSYIGLGVQPPEPSWGNLMRDGQAYLNSAWWIAAFSGMFLVIFVLSINIFAEGLRRVTTQRQRL
jgi:peptide/nickel transport system permease protein